jgi:hypothetical protein
MLSSLYNAIQERGGNYGFDNQIDQWSAEIWKKHSWLKDLEFVIDRDFFNI